MHIVLLPLLVLAGPDAAGLVEYSPPSHLSVQADEWTPLPDPDPEGILPPLPMPRRQVAGLPGPRPVEGSQDRPDSEAQYREELRRVEEIIRRTQETVARAQAAADAPPN